MQTTVYNLGVAHWSIVMYLYPNFHVGIESGKQGVSQLSSEIKEFVFSPLSDSILISSNDGISGITRLSCKLY